eukprot:XP_011662565.1 PREDICTED: uncharacterized protein LOC105437550 [Strongylocentrotus purpuratus]
MYRAIPSSIFFQALLVIPGSVRVLERNGNAAEFTASLLDPLSADYNEYIQEFVLNMFFNMKQRNSLVQSVNVTSLVNGSIITGFDIVAYRGQGANAAQFDADFRASLTNVSYLVAAFDNSNLTLLLDLSSIMFFDQPTSTPQAVVPSTTIQPGTTERNLGLIIGLVVGAIFFLIVIFLCGCLMLMAFGRRNYFEKVHGAQAYVDTQDPLLYPDITAIRPRVIKDDDSLTRSSGSEVNRSSELFDDDNDNDNRIDHMMRVLEHRRNTIGDYSYNQRRHQTSSATRPTHARGSRDDAGVSYRTPQRVFSFNDQDRNRMTHLTRVLQNAGRIRELPYAHAPPRGSSIYGTTDEDTMTSSDQFTLPYLATGEESARFVRGAVPPPSYHSGLANPRRRSLRGGSNHAQMPVEAWF